MTEQPEKAIPLTFSVMDYVHLKKATGYVNSRDFMLDELIERLPKALKRFSNDVVAKSMLSHTYGELLAKDFREWIRCQMDESLEYADGGASIECYEEEEARLYAAAMGISIVD